MGARRDVQLVAQQPADPIAENRAAGVLEKHAPGFCPWNDHAHDGYAHVRASEVDRYDLAEAIPFEAFEQEPNVIVNVRVLVRLDRRVRDQWTATEHLLGVKRSRVAYDPVEVLTSALDVGDSTLGSFADSSTDGYTSIRVTARAAVREVSPIETPLDDVAVERGDPAGGRDVAQIDQELGPTQPADECPGARRQAIGIDQRETAGASRL